MVAPNLLVVKHRTTPTQLGFMSGGTTFTQLGGNVASGESWGNPQFGFPSNRSVWFKGVYFTLLNTGGAWQVHHYDHIGNTIFNAGGVNEPSTNALAHSCTGLHVTRGVNPVMFFAATGASNLMVLYTTTDGRNWTATPLGGPGAPVNGIGRCVLYRDQLYCPTINGAGANWGLIIINPTGLTMTTFDYGVFGWTFGGGHGSFCVFRNRLYLLRATNTTGALRLHEFTGGTMVTRADLFTLSTSATLYASGAEFLFPVGSTKMVALAEVDSAASQSTRGHKAWDIVPSGPTSFTVTDKTSTMIPTSLRRVADGGPTGVLAETNRWTGFVDNDSNATPGAPQVAIWLISSFGGGTYSYYEYLDSDTELSPGSTGVNQDFALPYDTRGGGDRTYSAGVLKAMLHAVAPSTAAGRMKLSCRVWGDIDPSTTSTNSGRAATTFVGRRVACRAATTAALPTLTYSNGASGVGATLTATANGALPAQDGVTLVLADRLLVKDQASGLQNGIYVVTQVGDVSNPFILTRATDFNQFLSTSIYPTAWTLVTEGTTLANTAWYFRAANPDLTIGTSAITFVQMLSVARFLRVWFSTFETPNMVQAALAGTPVTVPAIAPLATRNVDQIENVVADGATVYEIDWDAAASSLQNGQPVHAITRAGVI